MKKILCLILIIFAVSCVKGGKDDPLIVPPNFAEMPDPNKPEVQPAEQKEENISRLKELLLKSDE
jgi:hypothetical protein